MVKTAIEMSKKILEIFLCFLVIFLQAVGMEEITLMW